MAEAAGRRYGPDRFFPLFGGLPFPFFRYRPSSGLLRAYPFPSGYRVAGGASTAACSGFISDFRPKGGGSRFFRASYRRNDYPPFPEGSGFRRFPAWPISGPEDNQGGGRREVSRFRPGRISGSSAAVISPPDTGAAASRRVSEHVGVSR